MFALVLCETHDEDGNICSVIFKFTLYGFEYARLHPYYAAGSTDDWEDIIAAIKTPRYHQTTVNIRSSLHPECNYFITVYNGQATFSIDNQLGLPAVDIVIPASACLAVFERLLAIVRG